MQEDFKLHQVAWSFGACDDPASTRIDEGEEVVPGKCSPTRVLFLDNDDMPAGG